MLLLLSSSMIVLMLVKQIDTFSIEVMPLKVIILFMVAGLEFRCIAAIICKLIPSMEHFKIGDDLIGIIFDSCAQISSTQLILRRCGVWQL